MRCAIECGERGRESVSKNASERTFEKERTLITLREWTAPISASNCARENGSCYLLCLLCTVSLFRLLPASRPTDRRAARTTRTQKVARVKIFGFELIARQRKSMSAVGWQSFNSVAVCSTAVVADCWPERVHSSRSLGRRGSAEI